jgi:hypothetical protein
MRAHGTQQGVGVGLALHGCEEGGGVQNESYIADGIEMVSISQN